MADSVLLFGGEGTPCFKHRLLFLCQFDHAALGEELGQRDAKALADHPQCRNKQEIEKGNFQTMTLLMRR